MQDYDSLQDSIFGEVDKYKQSITDTRPSTLALAAVKPRAHVDDSFGVDLARSIARSPATVAIKHRDSKSLTRRGLEGLQSTQRLAKRASSRNLLRNSAAG